jgi:hypothetical protein
MEVLGFRQKEKETLGAVWARFLDLNMSSPNLELSEPMLLQHFCRGHVKESAQFLEIYSRGSLWQPAQENTVLSPKTDPLWSLSNNKVSSYR